jgi:hypothetical protein
MTMTSALGEFIARLQNAETIPRPENEEWSALVARISLPGVIAEIDEETYDYFLDVLPPKYQRGGLFAFAEGAESLRLFWYRGGRYSCRQLTEDETAQFCSLARIPIPW